MIATEHIVRRFLFGTYVQLAVRSDKTAGKLYDACRENPSEMAWQDLYYRVFVLLGVDMKRDQADQPDLWERHRIDAAFHVGDLEHEEIETSEPDVVSRT